MRQGPYEYSRNGEILNIGTDVTHTTGEAIETVEDVIGRQATIETAPPRPGDQLKTCANIEKARRLLDYDSTTPLREGIEGMVDWYEQHIMDRKDCRDDLSS